MPKARSSSTHIRGLGDLTPDPQNANLGTERGRKALAQSLRELGPGQKTGRVAYAMDLDPRYVQATVTRWEQFTGQRATRLGRPTTRRRS